MLTNALQDASEVIDVLIALNAVRRVNFTGSTRVGRNVVQKAAAHLKCCLLELGGKSPLVVLDNADIDEAVKAAVFGSYLYQGQICMSTERIVVANDTAYGLSSVVFGKDVTRALAVALQIETGSCHVNGSAVQNEARAPYGGTKDNGYGRFDGRAVVDEFTELNWITLETSVQ